MCYQKTVCCYSGQQLKKIILNFQWMVNIKNYRTHNIFNKIATQKQDAQRYYSLQLMITVICINTNIRIKQDTCIITCLGRENNRKASATLVI